MIWLLINYCCLNYWPILFYLLFKILKLILSVRFLLDQIIIIDCLHHIFFPTTKYSPIVLFESANLARRTSIARLDQPHLLSHLLLVLLLVLHDHRNHLPLSLRDVLDTLLLSPACPGSRSHRRGPEAELVLGEFYRIESGQSCLLC